MLGSRFAFFDPNIIEPSFTIFDHQFLLASFLLQIDFDPHILSDLLKFKTLGDHFLEQDFEQVI